MTRTDTAAGLERFSLSGRISLITGATRGLGLEIARGMAAAGAVVGINGRNAERARDTLSNVVARHMAARGRGRLVFISSMVGPQSFQGDPAYVASKGGLESSWALTVDAGLSVAL